MQSGVFTADIGTTSFKAAVISRDGTVLDFTRVFFPQPVRAVDWVSAFFSAWRTFTQSYTIRAICISGNGPTVVSVPRRKKVSSVKVDGDSFSDAAVDVLIENAQQDTLFLWNEHIPSSVQLSQCSSLFLPRIAAFQQLYPEAFSQAQYVLSGHEYLSFILTGRAVTVLPDSRYMRAYWTDEAVRLFAFNPDLLPEFVEIGTEIGRFCGIPVIAGTPDFIAALIGSNTLRPGTACDRAGSSEGINICIREPLRFENTRLLPSVIADLWNVSFLIPDSGVSFAEFLTDEGFLPHEYGACMERIAAEPPLFSEEYPRTRGGRGRRFIENLAFHLRRGFDLLEQVSGYRPVYTLSGGQARNPLWCKMKADITGRTFALPHFADAELLGNAAVALYALGEYSSLTEAAGQMSTVVRLYEPEPHRAQLYREKYHRWQENITESNM